MHNLQILLSKKKKKILFKQSKDNNEFYIAINDFSGKKCKIKLHNKFEQLIEIVHFIQKKIKNFVAL